MSSGESTPYGLAVYEELTRQKMGTVITARMNYAQIQALKAADRATTLELFEGSTDELLLRIQMEAPERVAEYLVQRHKELQEDDATDVALCILSEVALWIFD